MQAVQRRSRGDEDDAHSGRPLSSTTQENIEQVRGVICKGRLLTIPVVDKISGDNKELEQRIFHYNFNMTQVYTIMVPMILSPEQKVSQMKVCADIFKTFEADPMPSLRVITYDESRVFKSKSKAVMIVFFYIYGIVYINWLPDQLISITACNLKL